jgi:hypothetical protein
MCQTAEEASLSEDRLATAQGLYYALTGIWPVLNIRTFQMVTGPKTDLWLVKTVGVLVAVIGTVLALAGRRQRVTPEIRLLAMGSALGLTGIELFYVLQRRILSVYLLDALLELVFVLTWTLARLRNNESLTS